MFIVIFVQPVKCPLYTFLEYIYCYIFFFSCNKQNLEKIIQNVSASTSHCFPLSILVVRFLKTFIPMGIWTINQSTSVLVLNVSLTWFSKMVFNRSLHTFSVSLGFPFTNGIMMVSFSPLGISLELHKLVKCRWRLLSISVPVFFCPFRNLMSSLWAEPWGGPKW